MMELGLPDDAIVLDQVSIFRYIDNTGALHVSFMSTPNITAYDLKAMLGLATLTADKLIGVQMDG